jgi:uncharacterized membrane protein
MGRLSRSRRERKEANLRAGLEDQGGSPRERAVTDAIFGAIAGSLALVVGGVRILFALPGGTRVRFNELQGIVFYFAAFVLAGAVLGLLGPMKRTRPGRYALGVLGAGIAMLVMMRGFKGAFSQWGGAVWASALFCSLFFGVALARQMAD